MIRKVIAYQWSAKIDAGSKLKDSTMLPGIRIVRFRCSLHFSSLRAIDIIINDDSAVCIDIWRNSRSYWDAVS